jgi:flagellar hook-associated protein 3 FlgL
MRSELDQVKQVGTNLARVKTEVDTAEDVLRGAVSLVERVQMLGSQGANGLTTPETRQDLAYELGSILEQLVATANTSVEGRYVFSGNSDQTPPYAIDWSQPNPVSGYQGSASVRQVQGPNGSLFSIGLTGQQIFDSLNVQENVFVSINNLRQALLNNDPAAISAAIGDVQGAHTYLNQQLAFYGTVQNRLASSLEFSHNYRTQLEAQLGELQDADEAQAITELLQSKTQLEAALGSRAQLPRQSLFDYLG